MDFSIEYQLVYFRKEQTQRKNLKEYVFLFETLDLEISIRVIDPISKTGFFLFDPVHNTEYYRNYCNRKSDKKYNSNHYAFL